MNARLITTSSSALPGRPERPFKYVHPATAPDGTLGYDRPLENYFDPSMAPRLLPSKPPARLYDTVARAHDHRFEVSPDMVDPSWTTPRPLILHPPERRHSLAKLTGNTPDYMGISPDQPEWRPRRSPYEDRRGIVGVAPNQVNMLVPYIPPIDTTLPPPSREWLDARAKQFLADAHADFDNSQRNSNSDVAMDPTRSLASDDTEFFEYDTDSTCDGIVCTGVRRASVAQTPQRPAQTEAESTIRDYEHPWNSDSDSDTDTDIDMYDGNPPCTPLKGPWIIPRKRPSVMIVDGREVARDSGHPSSEDEQPRKRRRRGRKAASSRRVTKKPKKHPNNTPARQGGSKTTAPVYYHHHYHHILDSKAGASSERARSLPPAVPSSSSFGNDSTRTSRPPVSSITAATTQMKQVRIASPSLQPQPHDSSVPPRSPKVFPCLMNGCEHICTSLGDLQRHQQSLRHSRPSHCCLACGKSYTRLDALKRHLNSKASCKKAHAAKQLENGGVAEEGLTEAN